MPPLPRVPVTPSIWLHASCGWTRFSSPLIHQLQPWPCLFTALGAAGSRWEMGLLQMSRGSLVPSQPEQNYTSGARSTVAMKPPKPCPSPLWDGPGQVLAQGRSVLPQLVCWQRGQEGAHGLGWGPRGLPGPSARSCCRPRPFLMAHPQAGSVSDPLVTLQGTGLGEKAAWWCKSRRDTSPATTRLFPLVGGS